MLRKRSFNVSNSANCTDDNHFRKYPEVPSPAALFVFIDTDEDVEGYYTILHPEKPEKGK